MSTMAALQYLGLDRQTIRALSQKAKNRGKSAPQYVRDLVAADLVTDHTFDSILEPIRQGFRESGVTPEAFDKLVKKARKANRQPKARRR